MKLTIPTLKEGLSSRLESNKIPQTIVNTQHEETTKHNITHKDILIEEKEKKIILTIPKNSTITQPITIESTYITNGFLHLEIQAKEGSSATIERTINEEEQETKGMITEHIIINIEKNAKITYNEKQELSQQTSWHIKKEGKIEEKGNLQWYHHTKGGNLSIQEIETTLLGEKAKTTLLTTTNIQKKQHHYTFAKTIHKAANTTSRMYAKSVIGGKAKTLHKGLIRIEKKAETSTGYQQEDSLLTHKDAEANTIPQLEINNPDVTCSHGATIGDINEEQLFYLQSRGLNEEKARTIITTGFLKNIITCTEDETWKKEIITLLERGKQT